MSMQRVYDLYVPTCDLCGESLPGKTSINAARHAAKEAGWQHKNVNGNIELYCTECKEEEQ